MGKFVRRCVITALLLALGTYVYFQLPVRQWAKQSIIDYFAQSGMVIAGMDVETISPIGAEISNIEVVSPSHYTIGMLRIEVLRNKVSVENLVVPKMLDDRDTVFNATAHVAFEHGRIVLPGELKAAPQDIASQFTLIPTRSRKQPSVLRIDSASVNWQGTLLSVQNLSLPLPLGGLVDFTLHVADLPLQTLARAMLSPQAEAAGTLAGDVALEYAPGHLGVLGMDLTAIGPGTLKLPPGILPAATPDQAVAARSLADFHYNALTLATTGTPPVLMLGVQGNAPAISGPVEVKYQVNLGANVLPALNGALTASQPVPVPTPPVQVPAPPAAPPAAPR